MVWRSMTDDRSTRAAYRILYARAGSNPGGRRPRQDDAAWVVRTATGGSPIVDAGCGQGRYTGLLGPNAIAVDWLHTLTTWRNGRVVLADLRLLPLQSRSCGGYFANLSLIHLDPAGRLQALMEAARVVDDDGPLFFSFYYSAEPGPAQLDRANDGRVFHKPTLRELTAEIGRCGLILVDRREHWDRAGRLLALFRCLRLS